MSYPRPEITSNENPDLHISQGLIFERFPSSFAHVGVVYLP